MIRIPLAGTESARVRFAMSPVYETVMAVSALLRPGVHGVHLPWVRPARTAMPKVDPQLKALLSRDDAKPGFLLPPPDTRLPGIEAELRRIAATPREAVDEEARNFTRRRIDLVAATDALRWAYNLIVAPYWERMARLLEADIAYRAGILADGGLERLFADLHGDVVWRPGNSELVIHPRRPGDQLVRLGGRGIVLCPSVFCWPRVTASVRPTTAGTLRYPARAVATLWETPTPAPDALAKLIGTTRAAILTELAVPATTGHLAKLLGVTKGAVSQHLTVLRAAGLVATDRNLHLRTAKADALTD
jgi:hypothetical protein